jgi:hypothetical protein
MFFVFAKTLEVIIGNLDSIQIKKTPEMGLGIFVKDPIESLGKVFCVDENLAIHSDDANYLLEFVMKFNDDERLKAYILYHRFQLKEKSKIFNYLKNIENDLNHPVFYEKSDFLMISSVFEYIDLKSIKSLTEKFQRLLKVFKGLSGLPKEMMLFENYLWASHIVMSRSLVTFNKETNDYSYLFIPYIDLVNYWPIDKTSKRPSNFSEVILESGSYCLYSSLNLQPGDQVFTDYSISDLPSFFLNFGFVIESDPSLSLSIHLSVDPCLNCTFALKPFEVNWQVLQKLMRLSGKDYSPEVAFRKFLPVIKDLYIFQDILAGLLMYRLEIKGMLNSLHLGLRDLRRQSKNTSGKKKNILNFGGTLRCLIYTHLKTLEKEVIFGFYTYLFN